MTSIKDTATVLEKINDKLKRYFNIQITEATKQQLYNACAAVVRDILLEKRNAICMTCGRVSPLSERASFDDLAIEFESSSPRTAERAYRRAVEKLTLNLVELGELHAVRIERVASGAYRYQADNDGDWGEFTLDAETGEMQIISLAGLDTTKTHRFAGQAARYLRLHAGEKLPKTVLVTFE